MDFLTAPTITMKVLFVFIVLEYRRRQIVEAFANRESAATPDSLAACPVTAHTLKCGPRSWRTKAVAGSGQ
jgi:hypothetical protein